MQTWMSRKGGRQDAWFQKELKKLTLVESAKHASSHEGKSKVCRCIFPRATLRQSGPEMGVTAFKNERASCPWRCMDESQTALGVRGTAEGMPTLRGAGGYGHLPTLRNSGSWTCAGPETTRTEPRLLAPFSIPLQEPRVREEDGKIHMLAPGKVSNIWGGVIGASTSDHLLHLLSIPRSNCSGTHQELMSHQKPLGHLGTQSKPAPPFLPPTDSSGPATCYPFPRHSLYSSAYIHRDSKTRFPF